MRLSQNLLNKKRNDRYGLGLMLSGDNKEFEIIGRDGQIAGFHAFMRVNPASRIGIILLRNCHKDCGQLEAKGNALLIKLLKASKK